ncbi:MAG: valine--pyruvate transaminase [Sedimentisphaerales bacterium]|nr:valine--pyruvate transaminase [Sedimentisphaerales bacterium]
MRVSKFGRKAEVESGIGRLMDDLGAALAKNRDVFMLGGGNPAHIPDIERHWRRSMTAMLADGDRFERAFGNYDPPQGNLEFIEAISGLLRRELDWPVGPRNVVLTNGSQSAFFILFNLFAGDYPDGTKKRILLPVLPEYIGYRDVGLTDDLFVANKPRIEHLDERVFKYHIDFDALEITDDIGAVCVSRPTNPTGNVLTDAELARLSDIARAGDVPLIVDSAYGMPFPHIVFTEVEPLWNKNTIVCMSLSKLGLPATRTGIVVAREEIVEKVARLNAVMSLAPGGVGTALVTELVRSGEIIRLSRDVIRPFYQAKAEHALAQVRECFRDVPCHVHKPEGAFFIWLWFPGLPITNRQLYERVKERNVLVVTGHYFFPGLTEPWRHTDECIRVSYAQDDRTVAAGLRIIAEEVRRAHAEAGCSNA